MYGSDWQCIGNLFGIQSDSSRRSKTLGGFNGGGKIHLFRLMVLMLGYHLSNAWTLLRSYRLSSGSFRRHSRPFRISLIQGHHLSSRLRPRLREPWTRHLLHAYFGEYLGPSSAYIILGLSPDRHVISSILGIPSRPTFGIMARLNSRNHRSRRNLPEFGNYFF